MSELLSRLGVECPIIQAPMAGVSTPALAAAVAEAGALGSISVGATDAAGARTMMAQVRERTQRAVNVNVFCHQPARRDPRVESAWIEQLRPEFARVLAEPPAQLDEIYKSFIEDDAMLAALIDAKPHVISFHFGMPSPAAMRALRATGAVLLATATCVDEAQIAVAAGAHAIVAQGWEAGGHRGVFDPDRDDRIGTLALVQSLVRVIDVPVIAAGGIMDGAGITAALRLGASAAQLGTAFVACPESSADEQHRRALFSDRAHHTLVTRVVSGRPVRCLPNRLTALDLGPEIPAYPVAYAAAKALHAAARARGSHDFAAQLAGQGAPLARALPAGELVATLRSEIR